VFTDLTSSCSGQVDSPTVLSPLSSIKLAITTDAGILHIYDLGMITSPTKSLTISTKPSQTYHPHSINLTDLSTSTHISSLTPLPPLAVSTSKLPKHLFTTGGTTISITNILSKKRLFKSITDEEDFSTEEELLSSTYIPLSGTDLGVIAVGDANCNLYFYGRGDWKVPVLKEKVLYGGDTIDTMTLLPASITKPNGRGRILALGCGDGVVALMSVEISSQTEKLTGKKGIKSLRVSVEKFINHSEGGVDGVTGIGWVNDPEESEMGRMITVGGDTVRIWGMRDGHGDASGGAKDMAMLLGDDVDTDDEEDDEDDEDVDNNSDTDPKPTRNTDKEDKSLPSAKKGLEKGDESSSDNDSDTDSDSDSGGKKRRKRKKGKKAKKARLGNTSGSGMNIKLKRL
jgi:hypothetical protein